jgi:hypothetical protein
MLSQKLSVNSAIRLSLILSKIPWDNFHITREKSLTGIWHHAYDGILQKKPNPLRNGGGKPRVSNKRDSRVAWERQSGIFLFASFKVRKVAMGRRTFRRRLPGERVRPLELFADLFAFLGYFLLLLVYYAHWTQSFLSAASGDPQDGLHWW